MIKIQKRVIFISAIIFSSVLAFSGTIYALKVVMNGTPQKNGFRDDVFTNLKRAQCETCHGASLADRHHQLKSGASKNCSGCHAINNKSGEMGVNLKKECSDCHKVSPHHKTKAAVEKKCRECHESSGVSEFKMQGPEYKFSKITPTVNSCSKCHRAGDVAGGRVYGMKDTHHGTQIQDCNMCHDENKSNTSIRVCERCHDVKALHAVEGHIKSENCAHCHDMEEKQPNSKYDEPVKELKQ